MKNEDRSKYEQVQNLLFAFGATTLTTEICELGHEQSREPGVIMSVPVDAGHSPAYRERSTGNAFIRVDDVNVLAALERYNHERARAVTTAGLQRHARR